MALVCAGSRELIPLHESREMTVGRSPESDIVVTDPAASWAQATLRWDGGERFCVRDCGSLNGTYVQGRRIDETTRLEPGMEVCVGGARLIVVLNRPPIPGTPREISRSPAMQPALEQAERAARRDITVLIRGETGVGKEVLARSIHDQSARVRGPFIAINCAAINETIAESTLFGHEKGSFTGARDRHLGVFEAADGGTLLLDEIGELSPGTQARLLRVLEERTITRVGSTDPIPVDVRVIAATHRDLEEDAASGRFRQDLLYRVAVLTIVIPPLRERPEDIRFLAELFLKEVGGGSLRLDGDALSALERRPFPGNVRELRNLIEAAAVLSEGDTIQIGDFPNARSGAPNAEVDTTLSSQVGDFERDRIVTALDACSGNQSAAARRLGITRRALIYRMEKHGLKPSR